MEHCFSVARGLQGQVRFNEVFEQLVNEVVHILRASLIVGRFGTLIISIVFCSIRKLRKVNISFVMSVSLSVRPHGSSAATGLVFMKFYI